MIIKSFVAESSSAALKQVRREMGGDAVVLKTRQVRSDDGISRVEVTACLDKPTTGQSSVALADRKPAVAPIAAPTTGSRLAPDVIEEPMIPAATAALINDSRLDGLEAKLDRLLSLQVLHTTGIRPDTRVMERVVTALRSSDTPDEFITGLLGGFDGSSDETMVTEDGVYNALVTRITEALDPVTPSAGDRVLAMGPAGTGKTTFIGKLACDLVTRRSTAVKLMSLDSHKVAARDEIESYGELLGVDVIATDDDVKKSIDNEKVVLIDSAALSADKGRADVLAGEIARVAPTHRLMILSSLTRYRDLVRQIEAAASLAPTHLVATMTDLTDCWGAVIAAAVKTGVKLALVSNSPLSTTMVETPQAEAIASVMLRREGKHD
ncbi:MAG: hypothetical protein KKA42_04995 [candidate division Zixibacteria bacterium]|nr:hypothetical protein [candidate division Zixibacteria bacterium]